MPASSGRLVAVEAPPGPPLAEAILTALDAGDAVLPLPPDTRRARELVEATRPHLHRRPDGDSTLPDPAPVADDVALVVATSGSVGPPRAVELTTANLDASVRASVDRLGCRPGERWLACLPLHHVAGVLVLLRARHLGTEPIVHERFDASAVAASQTTYVSLVPTMLVRLLDTDVELTGRRVLLGGAPPPDGSLQRAALAGVVVTESYGMTETCGGCVYDGLPLDGVEAEILEPDDDGVGRIAISGPVVAHGYRPGERFGGTFVSQDLGRRTETGRVEVVGRADDVIITGGVNVSASEVAAVLAGHPDVAEAAVHGRPDPEWGERVVAVVVPADPQRAPSLEDLRDHVAGRLAAAAAPREVVLADRLPRTDLDKLRRRDLPRPAS